MIRTGRDHLDEVGESYGHHWRNATRFGVRMIGAGTLCCLHGIVPGLFSKTASNSVKSLYREMNARGKATGFDWVI